MPFQISHSTKKVTIPNVTLISAGPDQVVICGVSTIFLTAQVDDPLLLVGHSLLWEQIEGNNVLLSTPTQITTSYPFTDPSDKVFRFWIDKGTANAQYADISIQHTPTSKMPSWANAQFNYQDYQAAAKVYAVSGTIQAPVPVYTIHNNDVTGIPAIKIEWNSPLTSMTLIRTELWRKTVWNNDPYVYQGVVYPTDGKPEEFIGPDGYYIVRSVFAPGDEDPDGTPREIFYDTVPVRARDFVVDGLYQIADDVVTANTFGTVTVTRYTITLFTTPTEHLYMGGLAETVSRSVVRYSNIQFDTPTDSVYMGGLAETVSINIIRTNQSGIGGTV